LSLEPQGISSFMNVELSVYKRRIICL